MSKEVFWYGCWGRHFLQSSVNIGINLFRWLTLCSWAVLLHVSTDNSNGKIPKGCSENTVSFYVFPPSWYPDLQPRCHHAVNSIRILPCVKRLDITQGVIWVRFTILIFHISEIMGFSCFVFNFIYFVWFLIFCSDFFFSWEGKYRCSWNRLFHHPSGTLFGWINEFMDYTMQSYCLKWNTKLVSYLLLLSLTEEESPTHLFF